MTWQRSAPQRAQAAPAKAPAEPRSAPASLREEGAATVGLSLDDRLRRAALLGHRPPAEGGVIPPRTLPSPPGPRVQRVFTHQSKPIPNALAILRYLLDQGLLSAEADAAAIQDFQARAGEQETHRLAEWLKANGIRTQPSTILRQAAEWAKVPHGGPAPETAALEDEDEDEEEDGQEQELPFLSLPFPEQDDDSDDESFDPRTNTGDAPLSSTDMALEQSSRFHEESDDEKSEAEEEADGQDGLSGEHPILVITWNLEKFGRKSDAEKKKLKQEALLKILDVYHPSVLVLQEVTDAGLLFQGEQILSSNPVPFGSGLETANLHDLAAQAPVEDEDVPDEDSDEDDFKEEAYNPLDPQDLGLTTPHYPLGHEFGLEPGPKYQAGKTYREYYPLLYDKAQVRGAPEGFFIRGGGDVPFTLEKLGAGHVETFSSEEAITRELLVWKVPLQIGGYLFRQSTLAQAPEPKIETQDLYVCVVHTSPSNAKGIRTEVEEIMEKADWLRQQTGCPVVLGGDWYMEKQNEKLFGDLAKGAKPGWTLAASEVEPDDTVMNKKRKTWHDEDQQSIRFHQTNFPHHGSGQTADHFVLSEDLRVPYTRALPSGDKLASWQGPDGPDPTLDEAEDLQTWTDIGADHVPVMTVVYMTVTDPPGSDEPQSPVLPGPSPLSGPPPSEPPPLSQPSQPQSSLPSQLDAIVQGVSSLPVPDGLQTSGGASGAARRKRRRGDELSMPQQAVGYVAALTNGAPALVPIGGGGLSCYVRSIVTGLARQYQLQPGHDIESIVEDIRQQLHAGGLAPAGGPLNAGGAEAPAVRHYIQANSNQWFGVANLTVEVNIVQWQNNQGYWQVQHFASFGDGNATVWLYFTPGGIGHFDLIA